jgi:hypothetical protein
VERRSETIQHTAHSGTTSFWSPTCGLCTSPYGFAWTCSRLSSCRACSTLHQDPGGELIYSFNITFPKLSVGHIDVHPSVRLLSDLGKWSGSQNTRAFCNIAWPALSVHWVEYRAVSVHAMKVWQHSFLTLAIEGGEWSAWCSSSTTSGTHWIGGSVGSRTGLNTLQNTTVTFPCH